MTDKKPEDMTPEELIVAAGWVTEEELKNMRPLTEEELQPDSEEEIARALVAGKARLDKDPELVLLNSELVREVMNETGGSMLSVETALFQLHDERSVRATMSGA